MCREICTVYRSIIFYINKFIRIIKLTTETVKAVVSFLSEKSEPPYTSEELESYHRQLEIDAQYHDDLENWDLYDY